MRSSMPNRPRFWWPVSPIQAPLPPQVSASETRSSSPLEGSLVNAWEGEREPAVAPSRRPTPPWLLASTTRVSKVETATWLWRTWVTTLLVRIFNKNMHLDFCLKVSRGGKGRWRNHSEFAPHGHFNALNISIPFKDNRISFRIGFAMFFFTRASAQLLSPCATS